MTDENEQLGKKRGRPKIDLEKRKKKHRSSERRIFLYIKKSHDIVEDNSIEKVVEKVQDNSIKEEQVEDLKGKDDENFIKKVKEKRDENSIKKVKEEKEENSIKKVKEKRDENSIKRKDGNFMKKMKKVEEENNIEKNCLEESPKLQPFTKLHNDFCDICGGIGDYICCEYCPRSFHYSCAEPPLKPEDSQLLSEWVCRSCCPRPLSISSKYFGSVLKPFQQHEGHSYRLPTWLINYFDGIASDEFGTFMDLNKDNVKLKSRSLNAVNDETPLESVYCNSCLKGAKAIKGEGQIGSRLMIKCDFCPLHWHLDCLDPPLTAFPSAAKKWQCPNHSTPLLDEEGRERRSRRVRNPIYKDVPSDTCIPTKYGHDIEVLFDEQETPGLAKVVYRVPENSIKLSFAHKVASFHSSLDSFAQTLLDLSAAPSGYSNQACQTDD